MEKQKLKTYAPMVGKEDDVKNNSMKLYSYLLCISGLARYPENTRMFRHKNLVLTQIKKYTGITDKTVKLYLYELERAGLVIYRGTPDEQIEGYDYPKEQDFLKLNGGVDKVAYRKAKEGLAFLIWKSRNKEGVYHIPRPNPYTPIPEVTLEKLNTLFELDELEIKTYILCCIFRDIQVEKYDGKSKVLKYEDLREALGKHKTAQTFTDSKIRRTLYLLRGLGLIDIEDGYTYNQKGVKIPCFKLIYVGYYVEYCEKNFQYEDNNEDIIAAQERLEQYDKSLYTGECTKNKDVFYKEEKRNDSWTIV